MQIMMTSTCVQKTNAKYSVFCCVKMKISRSDVVKSAKFENLQISQDLLFCVGWNTLRFRRTVEYHREHLGPFLRIF
jgi:hypothetical protein